MENPTIQQRQQALVELMKKNGSLHSAAVEQAFLAVPRHAFLPHEPLERAYSDTAIAVRKTSEQQWTSSSSQPTMMAIMLEQMDLRPGMKVLEIGTGTGFNAALIAEIVGSQGRVVTVDIQPDLIDEARERLAALEYSWVRAVVGDGGYGFPGEAPYDRVILTVGTDVISPAWRDQLTEGGRLVLPLTVGKTQKSIAFVRRGSELVSASASDCGFMMLQGAFAGDAPIKTRLGPNPDLYIFSNQPLPVEGELVEQWLSSHADLIPSGVEITETEAWGSLTTWLDLQNVECGILFAEDEQTQRSDLPVLFYLGRGEEYRVKQSVILVERQGAAAYTRPPGQPAPFFDWNSPADAEEHPQRPPFELCVLRFGSDPAPGERLLKTVRAWAAAGRPGSNTIRIRAIPAEEAYRPVPGEYLLERPWTNLVVSFQ